MARAFGSYPKCHRFESSRRYHNGPLVKRLRHGPFTAVTRVRFSHGSPTKSTDDNQCFFFFQSRIHTKSGAHFLSTAFYFMPASAYIPEVRNNPQFLRKKLFHEAADKVPQKKRSNTVQGNKFQFRM